MILVMGFGPFSGVSDNPAQALALALNGAEVCDEAVLGAQMPVSYERSVRLTRVHAERIRPSVILGIGVAVGRDRPAVERVGRNRCNSSRGDVDGVRLARLTPGGPDALTAPLATDQLGKSIDADLSENAGDYVCNAWLYGCLRALPAVPTLFLHIPPQSIETERARVLLESALEGAHVSR